MTISTPLSPRRNAETHPDAVEEQTEEVEEHHRQVVIAELSDDARAYDGQRREQESAENRRAEAVLRDPDAATAFAPGDDHVVGETAGVGGADCVSGSVG